MAGYEVSLATRDSKPGSAYPTRGHQGAEDALRCLVDRNSEAHTDTGYSRVDPDHPASAVGEHAAAVAWVQGGVGLDHLIDDAALPRRQRSTQGRDDARGNTPGQTQRVADRNHKLTDF